MANVLNTHLEHAVDAEGVLELIVRDGVALVPVEMRKRTLEPCANTRKAYAGTRDGRVQPMGVQLPYFLDEQRASAKAVPLVLMPGSLPQLTKTRCQSAKLRGVGASCASALLASIFLFC